MNALPRLVVGAIIVDDLTTPGKVLAARRNRPTSLAGLWEFPGGKVEDGEAPCAALARELREELEVAVTIGAELPHPSGAWPVSDRFRLRLFFAKITNGAPTPGETHDQVRWLKANDLESIRWLHSDAAAISALRIVLGNGAGQVTQRRATEHRARANPFD